MSRTITLLTSGTHGDVVPYLALAQGLQQAGYRVRIATHGQFEPLIRAYDLPFVPVEANPNALFARHHHALRFDHGLAGVTATWRYLQAVQPVFARMLDDAWQACQGSDVVIVTLATAWGHAIAERLGVPCAWALLQPWSRTTAFPTVFQPWRRSWGPELNRATHRMMETLTWRSWRRGVNRWRQRTLALAPWRGTGPFDQVYRDRTPVLYGFSAHVVPRPHDWPAQHHVTGYWFAAPPPTWQPPHDLQHFLDAGAPPVVIGWGSMTDERAQRLVPHVLAAVQQLEQRAVLVGAGSVIKSLRLPRTVFAIDAVPHAWLFGRAAAVVHHGGAGTTAASVRAGVPAVVTPFAVDQFFWGERVHALGVGPVPVPARSVTAARLAAALDRALGDATIQQRARALADQIRTENGVANALAVLQQIIP